MVAYATKSANEIQTTALLYARSRRRPGREPTLVQSLAIGRRATSARRTKSVGFQIGLTGSGIGRHEKRSGHARCSECWTRVVAGVGRGNDSGRGSLHVRARKTVGDEGTSDSGAETSGELVAEDGGVSSGTDGGADRSRG